MRGILIVTRITLISTDSTDEGDADTRRLNGVARMDFIIFLEEELIFVARDRSPISPYSGVFEYS
jgi:hypothetical protein